MLFLSGRFDEEVSSQEGGSSEKPSGERPPFKGLTRAGQDTFIL